MTRLWVLRETVTNIFWLFFILFGDNYDRKQFGRIRKMYLTLLETYYLFISDEHYFVFLTTLRELIACAK